MEEGELRERKIIVFVLKGGFKESLGEDISAVVTFIYIVT